MKKSLLVAAAVLFAIGAHSQKVDYSVVSVPEESGTEFKKITSDNDFVSMPDVRRSGRGVNWMSNRCLGLTVDGEKLAFLSKRDNATNIFLKSVHVSSGVTVQRTNRRHVVDFSYSPDGKYLVFSETVRNTNVVFQTDANNGFVCRQITSGSKDYAPVYAPDMSSIYFSRSESNSFHIWGYSLNDNFLSSYAPGMNPCPLDSTAMLICIRTNELGKGELWRVNITTGVEECILSDASRSFSTPSLSPDSQWILMTGSSLIQSGNVSYWNTDIYVCRTDGSQLMQLTYHAADDLSPVWSRDGKYIYFISQRGSQNAVANVWQIPFEAKSDY